MSYKTQELDVLPPILTETSGIKIPPLLATPCPSPCYAHALQVFCSTPGLLWSASCSFTMFQYQFMATLAGLSSVSACDQLISIFIFSLFQIETACSTDVHINSSHGHMILLLCTGYAVSKKSSLI